MPGTTTDNTTEYRLLRDDWGGAYVVRHRGGRYLATRRDDISRTLSADTPYELRELIHQDYEGSPVPREVAP